MKIILKIGQRLFINKTEGKALDLSLRKFIIKVNDKEIATNGKFIREPNVDISPLFNKTSTTASLQT